MTKEQIEEINNLSKQIYDHAMYRAEHDDAMDNPEYIACEIMDLCDWMSPGPDIARMVAGRLCQSYSLPQHSMYFIKRHFDLAY